MFPVLHDSPYAETHFHSFSLRTFSGILVLSAQDSVTSNNVQGIEIFHSKSQQPNVDLLPTHPRPRLLLPNPSVLFFPIPSSLLSHHLLEVRCEIILVQNSTKDLQLSLAQNCSQFPASPKFCLFPSFSYIFHFLSFDKCSWPNNQGRVCIW